MNLSITPNTTVACNIIKICSESKCYWIQVMTLTLESIKVKYIFKFLQSMKACNLTHLLDHSAKIICDNFIYVCVVPMTKLGSSSLVCSGTIFYIFFKNILPNKAILWYIWNYTCNCFLLEEQNVAFLSTWTNCLQN